MFFLLTGLLGVYNLVPELQRGASALSPAMDYVKRR